MVLIEWMWPGCTLTRSNNSPDLNLHVHMYCVHKAYLFIKRTVNEVKGTNKNGPHHRANCIPLTYSRSKVTFVTFLKKSK